jgi:hypothetical protein
MKFNSTLKKIFLFSIFLTSNFLCAQTIQTNIPGLVIKNYECFGFSSNGYIRGNIINRSAKSFIGSLRVKIIDKEKDIVWQDIQKLNVDGQNGVKFEIHIAVGNCIEPYQVQITLEQ